MNLKDPLLHTDLVGSVARNPGQNSRALRRSRGDINITTHRMSTRLHVGKAMPDRCAHLFDGKTLAIVMNFHYNAIGRNPHADIDVFSSCVLGSVCQRLLANMKQGKRMRLR